MARWFASAVLAAGVGAAGPAGAKVFVEAELGGRWLAADWGNVSPYETGSVFGLGVAAGGTIGFMATPRLGIVAHSDVGVSLKDRKRRDLGHGAVSVYVDQAAVTLTMLLGGRFYPHGGVKASRWQPYCGLAAGLGAVAWNSGEFMDDPTEEDNDDGVSSVLLALEAGGTRRLNRRLGLGLGVRYIYHVWVGENELFNSGDFSPHDVGLHANLEYRF